MHPRLLIALVGLLAAAGCVRDECELERPSAVEILPALPCLSASVVDPASDPSGDPATCRAPHLQITNRCDQPVVIDGPRGESIEIDPLGGFVEVIWALDRGVFDGGTRYRFEIRFSIAQARHLLVFTIERLFDTSGGWDDDDD